MSGPPWGDLRQPDGLSCGASVLVVVRMLLDETYAERAGRAFGPEVLAVHRRVTRSSLRGRPQLPWPRALGTPPWAIARELAALTGVPHRARRPHWESLRAAAGPSALYVGNRLLPRHVVLVLGGSGADLEVYDPGTGGRRLVTRAALEQGRLGIGGWDRAWFAVSAAGR